MTWRWCSRRAPESILYKNAPTSNIDSTPVVSIGGHHQTPAMEVMPDVQLLAHLGRWRVRPEGPLPTLSGRRRCISFRVRSETGSKAAGKEERRPPEVRRYPCPAFRITHQSAKYKKKRCGSASLSSPPRSVSGSAFHAFMRSPRSKSLPPICATSTATGDAWLLDRSDLLAVRLARDGESEPVHIEDTGTAFTIGFGRAAIASTGRRSFTRIGRAGRHHPRISDRQTCWRRLVGEFQICLARPDCPPRARTLRCRNGLDILL
jgi:hypothetical protein